MKCRSLFSQVVLFVALAFALWGPKLGGYLDLMVLVPATALLVLAATHARIHVPRNIYAISALMVLGVVVWVGFSSLINGSSDPQGVLRSVRAAVTLLVLVPLFYFAARQRVVSLEGAFGLLVGVLLLNAAAVYAQAFHLPVQGLMADTWGFDKTIRAGRSFGFTAGYDSAGYLVGLASAAALAASLILRSWRWFFVAVFAAGAVGFTSRSSMLLFLLLATVVLVVTASDWRGNGFRRVAIVSGGVAAVVLFVIPRLTAGVAEFSWLGGSGQDYSGQFARGSVVEVLQRMAVLPEELGVWLVGEGAQPSWSDIGYVKMLYLGGLPLLVLMIVFYGYVVSAARAALRVYKARAGFDPKVISWVRVWSLVLFLMLVVMFLGNLKSLYFFTRGYHELFVVVVALMAGFARRREVKYADKFTREQGGPVGV